MSFALTILKDNDIELESVISTIRETWNNGVKMEVYDFGQKEEGTSG
jgi:hypothetical protein